MTTAPRPPTTDSTPSADFFAHQTRHELSGPQWVARFPGSRLTHDLDPVFRVAVENFLAALAGAGASVHISSTLRPKQRAYLMHWAHQVMRNDLSPTRVPAMAGVPIQWAHPSLAASIGACTAMVEGFCIGHLRADVAPSLNTLHASGEAIDMTIEWSRTLSIKTHNGARVDIASEPRTGMNPQLHAVGLGYGVVKYAGGTKDKPHWSINGH
ncbi:hypothetical protein [Massilia psychrophila]|jgi:hypothetical protein|uniref:hypothetical protein n=1 Tax=Massilia psychrophila TaxID=1603353 RepID=UPI001C55901E|nr:hypothetical protein [Massilia psychrophila]